MNLRSFVDDPRFNGFITAVIVLNAVLIGWYTYAPSPLIVALEWVCIGVFAVEIVLRFLARRSTAEYFLDPWNIFDIVIVAAAFVPASNGVAPMLRILRVLRVLRLVKAVPELRLIVDVLLKSVVSMKYIGLLAVVCFYIYAVIGVKLFGQPELPGGEPNPVVSNFSSVHESCFTLFRVLTGDDWSQLRYDGAAIGWPLTAYLVTWIALATFLLINLIVGAIINNYQEVQEIERSKTMKLGDVDARIMELLSELQPLIAGRRRLAARGEPTASPGAELGDVRTDHPGRFGDGPMR